MSPKRMRDERRYRESCDQVIMCVQGMVYSDSQNLIVWLQTREGCCLIALRMMMKRTRDKEKGLIGIRA